MSGHTDIHTGPTAVPGLLELSVNVTAVTGDSLAGRAAGWPWCRALSRPLPVDSRSTSTSSSPRASSGRARAAGSAPRWVSDSRRSPADQRRCRCRRRLRTTTTRSATAAADARRSRRRRRRPGDVTRSEPASVPRSRPPPRRPRVTVNACRRSVLHDNNRINKSP